jgi:hypothetical protein
MGSGMTSTDSAARAWLTMLGSAAAGSEPDSEPELIAPEGWRASSSRSRSGAPSSELTRMHSDNAIVTPGPTGGESGRLVEPSRADAPAIRTFRAYVGRGFAARHRGPQQVL